MLLALALILAVGPVDLKAPTSPTSFVCSGGTTCTRDGGALYITGGGGSSASAGAPDRSVQFNNDGGFGGAGGAKIDADGRLVISSMASTNAAPLSPDAGVVLYSEQLAGRGQLAWQDAVGLPVPIGPALWSGTAAYSLPFGVTTSRTDVAWSVTTGGSVGAPTIDFTAYNTSLRRQRFSTSTANTQVGMHVSSTHFFHQGNSAGWGGYVCTLTWTSPTHSALENMLIGVQASTTPLSATTQPSGNTNAIYAGYDTSASVYSLCTVGGSGPVSCSACSASYAANSTTNVYRLTIHAPSNGSSVSMELRRLDDRSVAPCTATLGSNIPGNTQAMSPTMYQRSGSAEASVALDIAMMYCQSDN